MGDIPIRSFERDLINSNKRVLKQEWNKVMNKVFGEGCKVEWREDMVSQLGFGVDILQKKEENTPLKLRLEGMIILILILGY
jgi:hypothetical protein